jgi:hypothetical protein
VRRYIAVLLAVAALALMGGCDLFSNKPDRTEHSSDISGGDSIWYAADNPHYVTRRLAIADNGKLIIKPGCIVKFATGAGFTVGYSTAGELQAIGTADSGIVFTSGATNPVAGDWEGFDFFEATRLTSRFSYCDISYGGFTSYGCINLDWGGSIKMDHTTIRNAPLDGIWTGDFGGCMTDFTDNVITDCGGYPIRMGATNMSLMQGGNTLTGNAHDAIYVTGGGITTTGTWLNQGVPYILSQDLDIGGDTGPVLTIAPGTVIKLTPGHVISLGYTVQAGLIADSVTFTSSADNPQSGDWYGIWFWGEATDSHCRLTNCTIAYGGGDDYGNIWVQDAVPTISGCTIRDSKGWGVYLDGIEYPSPATLLANNTFSNNLLGDIRQP